MYEKFIRKLVATMINISSAINVIACKIQEVTLKEEFYVFVPDADKPRYKHSTFEAALTEAKRLAEYRINAGTDIEILQVVKKLKGEVIPF